MITSVEEYNKLLYQIQSENKPSVAVRLPESEKIYTVDLNSRTIETPNILSVQNDHNAETIYFLVDRYFDHIDLSTTTCVIQYINAKGKSGIYFVPFYDLISYENKILFPWEIEKFLSQHVGTVKFAIRFYKIDENYSINNVKFIYNLNTQAATSKIVAGGAIIEDYLELNEDYNFEASVIAEIKQDILKLQSYPDLYWEVIE